MTSFRQGSKAQLFLELAQPDNLGFSRDVLVSEFVGKYEGLVMGNGGNWCRADGALGRVYNIRRTKDGNAISAVRLDGFNNKHVIDKRIPSKVRQELAGRSCKVLGISNVEIDHKDGRLDDRRPSKNMTVDDFQPLSKAANNAKRQHCKNCRSTGQRFDARVLGYSKGQVRGNGLYNGTCVGCYWHDPFFFNKEISKTKPAQLKS